MVSVAHGSGVPDQPRRYNTLEQFPLEAHLAVATRVPINNSNAVVLHPRPAITLTDDEFFDLCQLNSDWRIERTAEGALEIMAPARGESSRVNVYIEAQLMVWALKDRDGVVYGSSAGFILPNSATRSPDSAGTRRDRFEQLDERHNARFVPLCPEFVIEVPSPFDSMPALCAKIAEYGANGTRLGWLIDPSDRRVDVYTPADHVEILEAPDCP